MSASAALEISTLASGASAKELVDLHPRAHPHDGRTERLRAVGERSVGRLSFDELDHVPPERSGDDGARLEGRPESERCRDEPRIEFASARVVTIGGERADRLSDDLRVRMGDRVRPREKVVRAMGPQDGLPDCTRQRERVGFAQCRGAHDHGVNHRDDLELVVVGGPSAAAAAKRWSGTRRASAATLCQETVGARSRPRASEPWATSASRTRSSTAARGDEPLARATSATSDGGNATLPTRATAPFNEALAYGGGA